MTDELAIESALGVEGYLGECPLNGYYFTTMLTILPGT